MTADIEVPDIYEYDLRQVVTILDSLQAAFDSHNADLKDLYVQSMEVKIESGNGYQVGTLSYSDEQWRFKAHADWEAKQ